MRVFVAVLITLAFVAVSLLAQDQHSNAIEKKGADEFSITAPVRVGDKVLPAGRYRIRCNGEEITFEQLNNGQKTTFPCRGKELPAKASATEVHMNLVNGERVLRTLLLRGNNVEHTF